MGKKRGAGITRTRYAAFRGADFSTDPSLVESCRSPLCTNIVADGGGMPQKRLGYRTVQSLGDTVYGRFGAGVGGREKRRNEALCLGGRRNARGASLRSAPPQEPGGFSRRKALDRHRRRVLLL